jgi:hypothetical protein
MYQDISLYSVLVDGRLGFVIDLEMAVICDQNSLMPPGEQKLVEKACARVKLSGKNDGFRR